MQAKLFHKSTNLTLYLGDSIKAMNKLPAESVDMIFADPPYYLSNGGISVQSGKMVKVDKANWDISGGVEADFKFHNSWITAALRLLKPNGTLWISGTYHSIYLCGHSLQINGARVLNDISWFKPNGAPNISCRYFTASHETLIWASKTPRTKHTFNYSLMKYNKWEGDIFKKDDKQMRSVWCIPTPGMSEKKHGKHPTQKPVALLNRIITASTNEGDTILDPFTGSSTTGVSALSLKREFIGIDNSEEYLSLSLRRLQGHIAPQ